MDIKDLRNGEVSAFHTDYLDFPIRFEIVHGPESVDDMVFAKASLAPAGNAWTEITIGAVTMRATPKDMRRLAEMANGIADQAEELEAFHKHHADTA